MNSKEDGKEDLVQHKHHDSTARNKEDSILQENSLQD